MRTMKKNRLLLLVCFVLLIIFFVALSNGAATVEKVDFWQALFGFDRSKQSHQIIRSIRLSRVAGAFLVGSCFASGGALIQGVTRNPLADSGLLGINAGASLAMALSFAFQPRASNFSVSLMSLVGSFAVTLFIFGFLQSSKVSMNPLQLILAGVTISSFFTAINQTLTQFFNLQQDLAFWFVDGATNITWRQLVVLSPLYILVVLVSFSLGKAIPLIHLNETHALALRSHPKRTRLIAFCLVAVLTAIAVSLVGPASFVRLLVPPVVRGMVGTDYRYVLPVPFLVGGELVMLVDFTARMINPPFETPFGLVITLIGVPFLLIRVRREQR